MAFEDFELSSDNGNHSTAVHDRFIDEYMAQAGPPGGGDGAAGDQAVAARAEQLNNRPEAGTYQLLEHMINNGEMIRDGRFTPAGMQAIMDYIQNGPSNYGSPFGQGPNVRAGYAQDLLNRSFATGRQGEMELTGNRQNIPPQFNPFEVRYTPGGHRPDGNRAGTIYTPSDVSVVQRDNLNRERVVANIRR